MDEQQPPKPPTDKDEVLKVDQPPTQKQQEKLLIRRLSDTDSAPSSFETHNNNNNNNDTLELLNLAPGRLNALNKGMTRLVSSAPGTPRSRSKSPLPTNTTITDGNSSLSSLEQHSVSDWDILTDRAGLTDELSESQRKLHSSKEFHLPSTVLERLTEDTLEDVHAFSDLSGRNFSSNTSRVSGQSSAVDNQFLLEPLSECAEDEEGDADENDQQVILLTNMENLQIVHNDNHEPTDSSVAE